MTGLAADPLDPALVRVREGRTILGAGFLVAPDVIATCAHVVGDAERATVDLPLLGVQDLVAEVVERDAARDVAILRLDDPPPGALPVPARISGDVRDHRFRTFGFPRDMPDGVWATGRLVGAQAAGRIQMVVDDHWRIEPGFSGAPVWDEQTGDVVGMVVTTSARNASTAHLVPTTALGDAWTSPVRNPYRGLRPFTEADAELFHGREHDVDRLVELVARQRVVAIAGPSGSGKSSLVKAGLLPRLADSDVVEIGPDQEIPTEIGPLLVLDQFEEAVIADPAAARQRLARIVELGHRAVLTLRSRSVDELITKDTAAELNRAVWFLEPMSREQLAAAIERPAAVVGGLAFEAGLVRRILDDTAAETGALPLVSLVLQELCERRRGGWLTHADYEALGRVPGALSAAADAALTELDRTRARGLLTLLTRPDGEGGHARRSTRLDELEEPLRDTAHRLAAQRLVVIEDERVNLIHQALIDHWPTLRDWLTEDADFLSWRAKLTDLHASGGVLRDAPLAEAESWLAQRPDDVPDAQRQFIRRSTAAHTRDRRRWRTITAVVSVLALIAAVLVVVTARSNAQLDRRLREADANTLAEESNAAAQKNGSTALQMALTAFVTDPENPKAVGALLEQRLYWRGVDRLLPKTFTGDVPDGSTLRTSTDGRTLLIAPADPNAPVLVVHDPTGPEPRKRALAGADHRSELALSPDGRVLAEATPDGALLLWDLTQDVPPRRLAGNGIGGVGFSADSRWLLGTPGTAGRATLWDLRTGRGAVTGFQAVKKLNQKAHPLPGGTLVVDEELRSTEEPGVEQSWTVVRDLASGVEISARAAGTLLANGTSTYFCSQGNYSVVDTVSGNELTRGRAVNCPGESPDGRFLAVPRGTNDETVLELVGSDGRHHFVADPARTWYYSDLFQSMPLLVQDDRAVRAIAARGGGLAISELPLTVHRAHVRPLNVLAATPANERVVAVSENQTTALLDERGRELHRFDHEGFRARGAFAFDSTGTRLILAADDALKIHDAANGALLREIPLPPSPGTAGSGDFALTEIIAVAPRELLVAHMGRLVTFDPMTWRMTRAPLDAVPEAGTDLGARFVTAITGRAGRPAEVVVQHETGISVWNLDTRQRTQRFSLDAAASTIHPAMDSSGRYLAVATGSYDSVTVIDLVENREAAVVPADANNLIGFLGDHVLTATPGHIRAIDWRQRLTVTEVELPASDDEPTIANGRLLLHRFGGPTDSIPGEPQLWFDDLCRVSDRDFTRAERAALDPELTEERPCER